MAPSEAGTLVLRRPKVAYLHILSFFAQGPHIGLVSSHFRCRFRHVMLQLPGQQRHDTVRMQEALTIHSSSAGRGLGTFVYVVVYRASAEASLRCHESMCCGYCCDRKSNSFWLMRSNVVPRLGEMQRSLPRSVWWRSRGVPVIPRIREYE